MEPGIQYPATFSMEMKRFNDGIRSVDYVLVYKKTKLNDSNNYNNKESFEKNLENEGLQLQTDETENIDFIKIHTPHDVLCRYCEILKMKMPIKQDLKDNKDKEKKKEKKPKPSNRCFLKFEKYLKVDDEKFPKKIKPFKCEYTRNKKNLFDSDNKDFFTPAIRIAIVHFILERNGIDKLLEENLYEAAYPLHDGEQSDIDSTRSKLLTDWAVLKNCLKHQPIDIIKEYFGEEIALYFAWIGFYTFMLIPASIFGLITFSFGLISLQFNLYSQDICAKDNTIIMCPKCDTLCDYWYLRDACFLSKLHHLFDNNMTLAFAMFMSIWSIVFLQLWKRYSSCILHEWGILDYSHQAEPPRPAYIARLSKIKNDNDEPVLSFWRNKFPIYLFNYSTISLFICVAVASVSGVVIYRMSITASRNLFHSPNSLAIPMTAAVMDLIVITILNFVYDYLAVYLTNIEYNRTHAEYENSLTLKIYLFQFINYYSSIFYIAFLKGKFVGYPAKYNRIFSFRQEECGPGGCLMELCIQLTIIMIGKQAINAIYEMMTPLIKKYFKKVISDNKASENKNDENEKKSQWAKDLELLKWPTHGLFDEYLEMIIQFGFITIFVVAFPLAPLFALINNIFETRLDGKKFLKHYRRSIPKRVKDIGIWYKIMHMLVRISIGTSAFIIAFQSNVIPRLFYIFSVSEDRSGVGFLNFTLAYFNTSNFEPDSEPLHTKLTDVHICRYNEYRNPPWGPNPYARSLLYWRLFAVRLAFVVIFQYLIGFIQMFVTWGLSEQPHALRKLIKKEEYDLRESIIEREKKQALTD